jgi:hypothetical protein
MLWQSNYAMMREYDHSQVPLSWPHFISRAVLCYVISIPGRCQSCNLGAVGMPLHVLGVLDLFQRLLFVELIPI